MYYYMYGRLNIVSRLGKSKVWGRSYTTVPFTVRGILDIKNGDEIEWLFENGIITIKKVDSKPKKTKGKE